MRKWLHAVENVLFELYESETLGIVGESGSGNSTLARLITGLLEPTRGKIIYKGIDITGSRRAYLNKIPKLIQMVFQDPYASLNPRIKVGEAIAEPLRIHKIVDKKEVHTEVERLLKLVGLQPEMYDRFPHEFAGGQRQRIVIARALALKPEVLICDEAVSALDVSIQAQISVFFTSSLITSNFCRPEVLTRLRQVRALLITLDIAKHAILPSLTLLFANIASVVLYTRNSMIDILKEDYIRIAYAKGLKNNYIIQIHALKNAMIPTVTVIGLMIGSMVGGAVMTETIFPWPGVGRLIYDSVAAMDYPALQGAFLILAISVILMNIITDLIIAWLDPRIKIGG
ncbi:ABC transporter permease subunit [Thermoanaerobacter sp. A7A]|uniref:ABC transporter permease subunit n=1 Tax=Thermoanaerobacter sp. A7A TaxID=1350366 RepID=UPI00235B688B|nr:ABC transporter permease subunit [Thermoanaerobacter sp. A7A]